MMSEDGGSSPASGKFTARGGQAQLRACPMAGRSRVAEATLGSRKRGIHAGEGGRSQPWRLTSLHLPSWKAPACVVWQPRPRSRPSQAVAPIKGGFVTVRQ